MCRHFCLPFAPAFPWFGERFDMRQGTHAFILNLTCLFYLCKFNLEVHTKCWKRAFYMDYKTKFPEVKEAK